MMTIEEIMTFDPITLDMNATIDQVAEIMATHRIRHIPVVDKSNKLIGLLTQRDLLAASSSANRPVAVADFMRKKVTSVDENTELRSAAIEMQKAKIGCLPVLRDEKLIGIITDSDYVGLAINLLEQFESMDPQELDEDLDDFGDESIYVEDDNDI
ncbi:MAG: CBS domain-containing protein [Pseudomonadales bacterium]